MVRTKWSLPLALAAVTGAAACSSNGSLQLGPIDAGSVVDVPAATDLGGATDRPATTDGGNGSDAGKSTDAGSTTDVPRTTDGGGTNDAGTAPVDAGPPYDPCAAAAVVDLNAMGTVTAGVHHITRSNASVGGMAPLDSACGNPGHEVVFRYTPATSTALRVSTDNAGTDANFDTVAFALATCATTGMSLGCNDDATGATHMRTSTFTTSVLTAGTPVFIVVAGYTPPTDSMWHESGNFELTVAELPIIATGAACDVTGAANICAAGSTCLAPTGSDAGGAVCVAPIAAGAACGPTVPGHCATGLTCVTTGSTSTCQTGPFTESAIAAPTFLDACAMGRHETLVGSGDAGASRDDNHTAAAVTIPFTFTYYGAAQTSFWPSINGYGVFGTTAPHDSLGGALPLASDTNVVAPFLTDLVLRAAPGSDICTATIGAAPNRQFVVEWLDVSAYAASATHLTFELVLHETANTVDFVYSRLDPGTGADAGVDPTRVDGSHATIGLSGGAGAAPITHTGNIATTAGIRFTPR